MGKVLLRGFGLGGFRSLRESQRIRTPRGVGLVAGRNNAGKSNVLRFAQRFFNESFPELEWEDLPKPGGPALQLEIAYPIPNLDSTPRRAHNSLSADRLERAFSVPELDIFGDRSVWLRFSATADSPRGRWVIDRSFLVELNRAVASVDSSFFRDASLALTSSAGGGETEDSQRVIRELFPFTLPRVETIGAFRQIGETEPGSNDGFEGRGLVNRLAALAAPAARNDERDRPRFEAIRQFTRSVFQDDGVDIRVSADRDEIQITQNGRVLPLANFGTGMHQVIILAAAATVLEDTLVCIEEPEVHLHPILQRRLIDYLSEFTSNQYLIATHSAHMLDFGRAVIIHARNDPERGTVLSQAESLHSISEICSDLGYRPSDLIQANAVIWVEGPSDRIYLKYWIDRSSPGRFAEGVHYSIMFFGGSLLSHLSADDPSVGEFISLRRLNRHSMIVFDSDRSAPEENLNSTKNRLIAEFGVEDGPGHAWVPNCRTIENLVPRAILLEAVREVHPHLTHEPASSSWADPLVLRNENGSRAAPDKVKVARVATRLWSDGELGADLSEEVQRIVDFIARANGAGVR